MPGWVFYSSLGQHALDKVDTKAFLVAIHAFSAALAGRTLPSWLVSEVRDRLDQLPHDMASLASLRALGRLLLCALACLLPCPASAAAWPWGPAGSPRGGSSLAQPPGQPAPPAGGNASVTLDLRRRQPISQLLHGIFFEEASNTHLAGSRHCTVLPRQPAPVGILGPPNA